MSRPNSAQPPTQEGGQFRLAVGHFRAGEGSTPHESAEKRPQENARSANPHSTAHSGAGVAQLAQPRANLCRAGLGTSKPLCTKGIAELAQPAQPLSYRNGMEEREGVEEGVEDARAHVKGTIGNRLGSLGTPTADPPAGRWNLALDQLLGEPVPRLPDSTTGRRVLASDTPPAWSPEGGAR